ncbi:MAG: acetyl-CoA carboxylase biotin carboxyl carrier protein subunit [Sebaldella sp.]|nr:acetyl-CoA carboxylase biotin carboxyl carrier protein subunit [Sebaldella sp.]
MELKEIKELMKLIKEEDLGEIKVDIGSEKLYLKNSKTSSVNIQSFQEKIVLEEEPEPAKEIIKSKNVGKIKFLNIEKDMEVKEGAKLAVIETIGVDTDVKANASGILTEIFIADQSIVDYGKNLFEIELS